MSRNFVRGFLILKHQPAKLGVHRPCEGGDITSFICQVTKISKCHLTLWVKYHHPAKFGVYMLCESEGITFFICHVTTISKCHVTLWMGSPHPKSRHC